MGRPIVHYQGWFFEWSSVCDAPVTQAMRREEFEREYEPMSVYAEPLASRMERAIKNGTSYHRAESAEDLISGNRAGPDETELSFQDVLRQVGIPLP